MSSAGPFHLTVACLVGAAVAHAQNRAWSAAILSFALAVFFAFVGTTPSSWGLTQ